MNNVAVDGKKNKPLIILMKEIMDGWVHAYL